MDLRTLDVSWSLHTCPRLLQPPEHEGGLASGRSAPPGTAGGSNTVRNSSNYNSSSLGIGGGEVPGAPCWPPTPRSPPRGLVSGSAAHDEGLRHRHPSQLLAPAAGGHSAGVHGMRDVAVAAAAAGNSLPAGTSSHGGPPPPPPPVFSVAAGRHFDMMPPGSVAPEGVRSCRLSAVVGYNRLLRSALTRLTHLTGEWCKGSRGPVLHTRTYGQCSLECLFLVTVG